MSKKLKLDLEYTPDFLIIGVFSSLKDYRLCWLLNKQLKTDLRRLPDFVHHPAKQEGEESFSVFHYESEALRARYFLLSNRGSQGILFPEPKNMDYLFLCRQSPAGSDITKLVKSIREVPAVQAAYLLDKIPHRTAKGVLYDFEMYLNDALK